MNVGHRSLFRLYCFPYAGSSATMVYSKWQSLLPGWIDVCPIEFPGRGHRINDMCCYSMSELVNELTDNVLFDLSSPYGFFGHSLGAVVAFEVVHLLQSRQKSLPILLFVSGRNAPNINQNNHRRQHLYTDDELLLKMHELGGVTPELFNYPEILELFLPALRADFYVSENYEYRSRKLLDCFIQVFGGLDDHSTALDKLIAWNAETSNKTVIKMFKGGHFFIQNEEDRLLKIIIKRIHSVLAM